MIYPRKSPWFSRWFAGRVRSRLREQFKGIYVRGVDPLRLALENGPALVVSNHTSWWDPMLAIFIGMDVLGADGYALMDAQNLRRLPFLGRVGAYGVDLTSRQDGVRVLRYGARLLDRPGRLLWIYPQGRERPTFERLGGFQGGAAMIAKMAKLQVVFPVGVTYHFGGDPAPFAFVDIGAPLVHSGDRESSRKAQQEAVQARLDDIQTLLSRADEMFPGFDCVLEKKNPVIAAWAERLLAQATRYA